VDSLINELVSNSIKHAFSGNRDGLIGIEIHSDSNELTMIISDNGIGLSERIDFDNIDTLGLQLVKTLIGEIDAKIELKERNGTEFLIKFNHEIQKKLMI
jgi:two-component sensor histidine kinase